MSEEDYIIGQKQALTGVLRHCCMSLGYNDLETQKSAWILEREATIISLRTICAEWGDNDWDDNLNLSDIIEKHLHRKLGYR